MKETWKGQKLLFIQTWQSRVVNFCNVFLFIIIFIFSFIDIFHLGLFKVLRVLSRRLFNPLGSMLPCMVEAFDPCYTSWKHHQLRLDQEPNPNPIERISCTPSQVETSETWLLHWSLGHTRLDPHLRPSWLLLEQPPDQPRGSCFQQEVHRLYWIRHHTFSWAPSLDVQPTSTQFWRSCADFWQPKSG